MIYSEKINILVVYGGKNDQMHNGVFNDIYTLDLGKLSWINVVNVGTDGLKRFSHVCGIFGTKMLVFGGLNATAYTSPQVHVLELDQPTVNRLEKDCSITKFRNNFPLLKMGVDYMCPEETIADSQNERVNEKWKNLRTMQTYAPVPNRFQLSKGENMVRGFVDLLLESKRRRDNLKSHIKSIS